MSQKPYTKRNGFLSFHKPSIHKEEIDAVTSTLKSGWLSSGPKVKEFEQSVSEYLNVPYCIALNSGTAALHLALKAIGLKPNDEVIIPTNTFTATAEVITYFGAKPVLVDCRKDTLNLDEKQLEAMITKKTKAIMPVHFGGYPCDMDVIQNICSNYKLNLIDDAAHAFGSKYNSNFIGNTADITCFSFYATKNITTGEGGMAVTSNHEYAETIRKLSLHGISTDAWNRYSNAGSWFYEVTDAGYKYNMSDILASIGCVQIKKAETFLDKRTEIAKIYTKELKDLDAIFLPKSSTHIKHSWHLFVIMLNTNKLTINRNHFIEELKNLNIGSSVHFIPMHRHKYYQNTFNYKSVDFPNSEWVYQRTISLPIYPEMTKTDTYDVINAIKHIVSQYQK